MSCSCIKGTNWNFSIKALDVYTLEFLDYSTWNENEPYVIPEFHEITITIPEFDRKVTLNVKPGQSTIISNKDLGLESCIPDGIYCIEAYSCYSCSKEMWGEKKFTRQEAIMPQTECKIDNLIATSEDETKAFELNDKFRKIESVSKIGQTSKAAELYQMLHSELNKYNCDSCC